MLVSLVITCHWWKTLYSYCGAIGFKQYNPNKLAKYGLLFCSLCDSSTSYTYFTLPYAGKPEEIAGEAAKFYVTGTDEYTKYLVTEFNQYNSIQGCNISMEQYFTAVTLAKRVLQNNFTIVGTMWHDRKDIPNELKAVTDIDEKLMLSVHTVKTRRWCWFHISTKRNLAKRISSPWQQCMTK